MLENEYRFNKRFRDYVDRYCEENGVTVDQALEDEAVKGEFRRYIGSLAWQQEGDEI